ncbi:RING-finger-containing ubiquitin ligase [Pyrenophora tritici-repentis]|nr:RING-finger-containing ubiquitin ligase [Pyrenophora tritici-repentis]KAI0606210.1 RING-finger-containing ubiquitin ligase [Pyrenophora tritici-repentis]PZC96668.1 RING-finger-containing ubiquitin ligase [Pyrenophora tritici-repentis]
MEVRRDPRSFLFFIVLLLLINSPEPQQPAFNVRSRFREVIDREYYELGVLNTTRYGDFKPDKNKWLNVTGLRDEDGFAWELLDPVREKARVQSERILGDRWKRMLDGPPEEGEPVMPVYRNLSGYVQGEWTRSPLSRIRHPSDMGNASVTPDNPFGHLIEYDRNLTGTGGPLRMHITELEDKMRRNENKTISEISAKVVIGDKDSFGGNWWEFVAHGVHFMKSGTAVLTTTSDRFAGIFALSHMQMSPYMYSTSQEFLNWTIHEAIERQEKRTFPLWNPWTSAAEGTNEGLFQGHHCEFVLYLQELPSQYNVDMDWFEHELRFPTGAPISQHVLHAMSMVGFSPDCGFVIESKGPPDFPPSEAQHLLGAKTEDFNVRARHSILAFAISLAFQLSFTIKQMKETATPSMRSRVSFFTIAMMALGDGFTFLILIFMYLFLGTAQLALYSIAFIALFSVLTHLRFLMDIWSVQAAERARQERQEAAATPSPAPASRTATPAPSAEEGLPLPATAARPRPPTPIIIAPDQDDPDEDLAPAANNTTTTANTNNANANPRAELGALYSRFCLMLIVLFFITIQFATARTTYRAIYFDVVSFIYLSFWIPQIYRNIMRNCRRALRWDYVVGTSVARIMPIAYFYMKEDNEVLGPRFFVREGWAPPAYDYHPILREDEEGAALPLNVSTSPDSPSTIDAPSSSAADGDSIKASGESRSKGKKVFDCSICANDIEVPIIPAGADEASVTGMGGTSMILQRRQYMVTPCRHIFHAGCLEGWMRYRLMCPNCRESLPPL